MYQASRGRAAPPARRTYAAHKGMRYNCICPLYAPICKDPKPTRICPQYISAKVTLIMYSSIAKCRRRRRARSNASGRFTGSSTQEPFSLPPPASVGDRSALPRETRRPCEEHGRLLGLVVMAFSLLRRPSQVPREQGHDQSNGNKDV